MRTVVAMSGGVDSSVAAGLLAQQGRELIGVSLQTYDHAPDRGYGRCCSPDDFRDARRVAGRLGIPYYVFDEEEAFGREVIDTFVASYRRGLTPSPCVLCNSEIKFGSLLGRALALGADRIATGHYARLARDGRHTLLMRARDRDKDQSYFLFKLQQEQLARAEFPVGDLSKEDVRAEARRLALPNADKAESQEICFVEGSTYREFVMARAGDLGPHGDMVTAGGESLGRHEGIGGFTVGQRRGLGLGGAESVRPVTAGPLTSGERPPDTTVTPSRARSGSAAPPLYVIAIDSETGRVVVGPDEDLRARGCTVTGVNWIPADREGETLDCEVRIRHRHPGARARVRVLAKGRAEVEFEDPQRAVAPGQAAVFYDADLVLGGGWIESRL